MLKAVIEKLEDVAEALRSHYRAGTKDEGLEGKFVLGVEGSGGWALEDVGGLKTALGKERTRATEAEDKLKRFGDLDPAKAKAAMERVDELEAIDPKKEADKLAQQKVEAATKQLVEKHNGELGERDKRIGSLTKTVESLLIDSVATAAIAEAKGSVDLLLPHVRSHTRVKESDGKFVVEVIDKDGNVKIGDAKGTPMDIKGLVAEMRSSDTFGRAFEASGQSGSGKLPNNGGGDRGTLKRSEMTAQQKGEYVREHGQDAFLKLPK